MASPHTIPVTLTEHEAAAVSGLCDLYQALTLPNEDEPNEVQSILQRLRFLDDVVRELEDKVVEASEPNAEAEETPT
jgi:hypothetical protein